MADITIPPEAVEAAAREEYSMDIAASLEAYPQWEDLSERMRAWKIKRMSAALRAGIAAWPGAERSKHYSGQGKPGVRCLSLPLPKVKP